MVNRDYIMRMIEQLALFIGRAVFHRDAGQYEEAQRELDAVVRDLLGFDPESLARDGRTGLEALLVKAAGSEEAEVLGKVLAERAAIGRLKGSPGEEIALAEEFSVAFLIRSEELGGRPGRLRREIEGVCSAMCDRALAAAGAAVLRYFEGLGAYGKAEDILHEMARVDPGRSRGPGREFYARMAELGDEALAKGNLPRGEIGEGLRRLEELLGRTS